VAVSKMELLELVVADVTAGASCTGRWLRGHHANDLPELADLSVRASSSRHMHAGDPPPGVNDRLGQVVPLHVPVEQVSAHTHAESSPSCRSISSPSPTACSSRLVM
jgi:hypothetical protein